MWIFDGYEEVEGQKDNSNSFNKLLKNLINLKLVSYKDLPEERIQDYVDVRKLIEINLLQEDFEKNLHPSVHDLYRKAVATVKKIKQRDMNDTIG